MFDSIYPLDSRDLLINCLHAMHLVKCNANNNGEYAITGSFRASIESQSKLNSVLEWLNDSLEHF